jgi:hypothetical protein
MNAKKLAKMNNYIRAAGSLLELTPPLAPSRRIRPTLSGVPALRLYATGYRELGELLRQFLEAFPERDPSAQDRCRQWLSESRLRPMPLAPPEQWLEELAKRAHALHKRPTSPSRWKSEHDRAQSELPPAERWQQLISQLEACIARLRELQRISEGCGRNAQT